MRELVWHIRVQPRALSHGRLSHALSLTFTPAQPLAFARSQSLSRRRRQRPQSLALVTMLVVVTRGRLGRERQHASRVSPRARRHSRQRRRHHIVAAHSTIRLVFSRSYLLPLHIRHDIRQCHSSPQTLIWFATS